MHRHVLSVIFLTLALGTVWSAPATSNTLLELVDEKLVDDRTAEQREKLAIIRAAASTETVTLVKVNTDLLGSRDKIDIGFKSMNFQFSKPKSGEPTDGETKSWIAPETSNKSGSSCVTATKGIVRGKFYTTSGIWSLEPIGGGLNALVKVDATKLPPDHPEGLIPLGAVSKNLVAAKSNEPAKIDILVVLSKGSMDTMKDKADQRNWVANVIACAQLTFDNSGINIVLNSTGSSPIATEYKETGGMTDLDRLVRKGDPYLEDVHSIRETDQADIVVLVINRGNKGFCGRAFTTLAQKRQAFAIVRKECATRDLTFAHEIGHLLGASHDDEKGRFSYGHGFCGANKIGTVMASRRNCPKRIPAWSKPPKLGTAKKHNNSRVLNETGATISQLLP